MSNCFCSIFEVVIKIAKYILALQSCSHFSLFHMITGLKYIGNFIHMKVYCQTVFLKIFSDIKNKEQRMM